MNTIFKAELDAAVAGRALCSRDCDCPIGAPDLTDLKTSLSCSSRELQWDTVLGTAQQSALCCDTCPASESLIVLLNAVTFRGKNAA